MKTPGSLHLAEARSSKIAYAIFSTTLRLGPKGPGDGLFVLYHGSSLLSRVRVHVLFRRRRI